MSNYQHIDVLLLDIEGTICPITFVKDVLFPYAIEALPTVLRQKWTDPSFQPYLDAFPSEYRTSPATIQAHVEDLTARDVKIAYLKNLQGYLWQSGYSSRSYATPLFSDVIPVLRTWQEIPSKRIAIYSSGSVFAQKLLFAHVKTDTASDPDPRHALSTEDLTDLVSGWFDTVNAGLKGDSASYTKIARQLDVDVGKVLFLSDSVKEVEAATRAGMEGVVVTRPGNARLDEGVRERFRIVKSFEELELGDVTEGELSRG